MSWPGWLLVYALVAGMALRWWYLIKHPRCFSCHRRDGVHLESCRLVRVRQLGLQQASYVRGIEDGQRELRMVMATQRSLERAAAAKLDEVITDGRVQ
jgi:hypothetical protein